MIFPSTYTLESTCTISGIENVDDEARCAVSGQTITINNLFSEAFVGGAST